MRSNFACGGVLPSSPGLKKKYILGYWYGGLQRFIFFFYFGAQLKIFSIKKNTNVFAIVSDAGIPIRVTPQVLLS